MLKDTITGWFAAERRAWRGEQPLAMVFWVYGVLVSALLAAVLLLALRDDRVALQQLMILGLAVYTGWILTAVWRCSRNSGHPFWGVLARLLTVAWALNTVMVLGFLQLELLARYLRR